MKPLLFAELFSQCLRQLGDVSRALEVEILIGKVFGMGRVDFWINRKNAIVDAQALRMFYYQFGRLLAGEPISYILGQKEFYSQLFFLNRHVLIPRPETEILVEKALERIRPSAVALDIGAGSGIVSIILALHAGCRVVACEKSRRAIAVLQRNICRFQLEGRVIPECADLFPGGDEQYDMIVSNPPYLSLAEWEGLPVHIKNHEPKRALVAGPKGTETIQRIVRGAAKRLREKGVLLLEVGLGQREEVADMLRGTRFFSQEWFPDYQMIDRVVVARRA